MPSAADLLLALASDADAIASSDYPLGTYKGVNVDGLDPLKLAALHTLLGSRPFEDLISEYQPVAQASAEGPWLVRLPDDLIASLVKVSPPDQVSWATRWAATLQAQEAGWADQDADAFLGRLIPFAQTASFEGKALFLWIYS